jgi:hypothetical protein
MEKVYGELLLVRKGSRSVSPLTPQACHDVIFALSESHLRPRVMQLYAHLKQIGSVIQNPLTYKILVSCCTSAADAATLFTDMKRAGISLTPLIYHMLVEVMAQDNSKETWRLDGVIKDIHDRKCSIPDMFKTLTKDSLWVVASTVLKLRLPMEESTWLQVLEKAGMCARAISIWKGSDYLQTAGTATAMLDAAVQAADAEAAMSVWDVIKTKQLEVQEEMCAELMEMLSGVKDKRIYTVYADTKAFVKAKLSIFVSVLRVAAEYFTINTAKDMWRDMQAANIYPNEEALRLMMKAVSKNPKSSAEIYDVIKLSNLKFPPGSEEVLREAFALSEETRRRIPELQGISLPSGESQPKTTSNTYNGGRTATYTAPPANAGYQSGRRGR